MAYLIDGKSTDTGSVADMGGRTVLQGNVLTIEQAIRQGKGTLARDRGLDMHRLQTSDSP